jgi:predicted lipoprotein with Yx(FWY)xxD motif
MGRARIALMGIGLVLLIAGLAAPVAAQGAATLAVRQTTQLGRFVTDAQGRTLYEFRRDTGTVSACVDACLTTWPPLVVPTGQPVLAAGVGGTATVVVQADGRRQVVYNGKLLYYYRMDTAPGDTNGQGVGGNWFVVEAVGGGAGLPATGGGPVGWTWVLSLGGAALIAGAALTRIRSRASRAS